MERWFQALRKVGKGEILVKEYKHSIMEDEWDLEI
jgi:hypothetical protein